MTAAGEIAVQAVRAEIVVAARADSTVQGLPAAVDLAGLARRGLLAKARVLGDARALAETADPARVEIAVAVRAVAMTAGVEVSGVVIARRKGRKLSFLNWKSLLFRKTRASNPWRDRSR